MKDIDLAFVRRVLAVFNGFDGPDDRTLWWRTDEPEYDPITFFVRCNDVFLWGCSDCEEITRENIAVLEQACKDTKAAHEGTKNSYLEAEGATVLFCARVRKMRPQGAFYNEKYCSKELWPLLDACGPVREAGLGNPVAHT